VTVRDVSPVIRPWTTPPFEAVQDSVFNIEQHWVECLRAGVEPDTRGADNIQTLALALSAYEAAATRQSVHFGR
jgi:predicted dehydrogenase